MTELYSPTITKLKSGKYQYSIRYFDTLTGKRKRVSINLSKNTAVARRNAAAILQQKIDERTGAQSKDMTIGELSHRYLKWLKDDTTYQSYYVYQSALKLVLKDIDPAIIADNLPRPRVAQYFNDLLKTKSYSTVNVRRSALAGMYKYGVTYGYIKNNPVDKLTLNKPKQRKAKDITDKYLTDDEYHRLIEQFVAEGRDDYADFFQFLYYTGLRCGEAACLTYSDFHRRGGQWYVTIDGTLVKRGHDGTVGDYYKQKGAKTAAGNRVIFVPSPAMAIVRRHKQSRPFLFLNGWSGGPMVIENVNHALLTTSKRAKIKKRVTSHFFRHTHVSKLAEQGVPLDVIERRVGHSGTKTIVDIYEHITRNTEQKLETALGQI